MRPLINQKALIEELIYCTASGVFRWRRGTRGRKVTDRVGSHDKRGYLEITIQGRKYKAHRLAWLYVNGEWPELGIDHKDGDPANNAMNNLRVVTQAVNVQNRRNAGKASTSGVLGAGWCAITRKYKARIQVGGKSVWLGRFDTVDAAHQAYVAAKRRVHEGNTL